MASTDGIPTPERSDAADAPAQLLSMAEAIDLRIDGLDGQADDEILTLTERVIALEAQVAAIQPPLASTQTDLDALELLVNNMFAWTKLGTVRIEARSFTITTEGNGFALIAFAQPFKKTPIVLLTPGSGFGMATANGSNWTGSAAPGPYVHDNVYGAWVYPIGPGVVTFGGMKPNTQVRMNYVAIGEAFYTDRAASDGGPGWDVVTPPF